MVYRSTRSGLGLFGYPLQIFLMRLDYGRGTQSHLEKMVILEKWYSALKAFLPVFYEDKKNIPEYNEKISHLITTLSESIEEMNLLYDPSYEGLGTCGQNEKTFLRSMRSVMEQADAITAKAHVIDQIRTGDDDGVACG